MGIEGSLPPLDSAVNGDWDLQGTSLRDKRMFLYGLSVALDLLALIGGYSFALVFREEQWLAANGHPILILAVPVFLMLEIAREVQSVETLQNRLLGVQRALGALAGTALLIFGLGFLFNAEDLSRVGTLITFLASAVLIVFSKITLDFVVKMVSGDTVVGTIIILDGLDVELEQNARAVDVAAVGLWPDLDRPDMIDRLSRLIAPYDRVIVACHASHISAWATFLKGHDIGGEIVLDKNLLHGAVALGEYNLRDTLVLSRGPLNFVNRVQKRVFDLVFASLALVIFMPLMILVALGIKATSPGPIFFRQLRVGQGNRQFRIFKFRSMHVDQEDQAGDRSVGRVDDRITPIGKFIRRTSIDELPQIFNVLRGEMSVVGPRPHALGSLAGDALFWRASQQYWMRHALKPGITGLAQIRGFRGATVRPEDLERRVRSDLEYLSSWSLWNDVMILLKTLRVVVHKNAY
jgi:exopolysaccharide biosynthesis polyprenyl glycosylphosphotransferase